MCHTWWAMFDTNPQHYSSSNVLQAVQAAHAVQCAILGQFGTYPQHYSKRMCYMQYRQYIQYMQYGQYKQYMQYMS